MEPVKWGWGDPTAVAAGASIAVAICTLILAFFTWRAARAASDAASSAREAVDESRRQASAQAFRELQIHMTSERCQHGRRLFRELLRVYGVPDNPEYFDSFKVKLDEMAEFGSSGNPDYVQINSAIADYETAFTLAVEGIIDRDVMMRTWSGTLIELGTGIQLFIEHRRQRSGNDAMWSNLWDAVEEVDGARPSIGRDAKDQ